MAGTARRRSAIAPVADITVAAITERVKDEKLRTVGFVIAVSGAAISLVSFLSSALRPLVFPSTYVVSGMALVLFLRMLFSRSYRRGVDAANLAMQGTDGWPGKPKALSDSEWGLFGKRAGTPSLLWARAVLVLGILPSYVVQHRTGGEAGWLWFASAFVVMELSMMHLAINAGTKEN